MEVRNSNFAAFIDVFTSNTYVMVIMSDPSIRKWNSAVVIMGFNQTVSCVCERESESVDVLNVLVCLIIEFCWILLKIV